MTGARPRGGPVKAAKARPAPTPKALPRPPDQPKPWEARQAEIVADLAALKEQYPAAFEKAHPLKIGVRDELAATTGISRTRLGRTLRYHTRRPAYLAALAAGGTRIGLDGEPAGEITEAERAAAAAALETKRERRPT